VIFKHTPRQGTSRYEQHQMPELMTANGLKDFSSLMKTDKLDILALPALLINRFAAIPYFLLSKRVKATFSPDQNAEY
jgi:hypothetical protein